MLSDLFFQVVLLLLSDVADVQQGAAALSKAPTTQPLSLLESALHCGFNPGVDPAHPVAKEAFLGREEFRALPIPNIHAAAVEPSVCTH